MTTKRNAASSAQRSDQPTLTKTIDTSLNNIEVRKLPSKKIAEARQILDNLRFSDSYYIKVSAKYNSQALKHAVEEGQRAKVLNDIVRKLTGAYPDLDQALGIDHSTESKDKFQG